VGAYRHRLVFDLFPTQEADPLLALIRDKEAAEQRAAQAVDDALGELIARIDKPALVPTPGPAASSGPGVAAPERGTRPPPVTASVTPPNPAPGGTRHGARSGNLSAALPPAPVAGTAPQVLQTPAPAAAPPRPQPPSANVWTA
jgi:hypothetical protein